MLTAHVLAPGEPADLRTVIWLGWVRVIGDCRLMPRLPKASRSTSTIRSMSFMAYQQLSLFNAHYHERCFLPIHIYYAATGVGRYDLAI